MKPLQDFVSVSVKGACANSRAHVGLVSAPDHLSLKPHSLTSLGLSFFTNETRIIVLHPGPEYMPFTIPGIEWEFIVITDMKHPVYYLSHSKRAINVSYFYSHY